MQIMKFLAILVPLFALALAQSQFVRAVGGTNNDGGNSVVQTSDGGFAVAGLTGSYGAGSYDFFLVKFSSTGTYEWSRAVGGTSDDDGWSVVQTSDGGFAVAGMTRSYGAGSGDLLLVKFNASGSVLWSRAVGGTSVDVGGSVVQTSDSGFAVAGFTYSYGAGTPDYCNLFLVKFSSTGTVEWSRAVGGTSYDVGYSVVETSDGGLAVAGLTYSYGAGSPDYPNLFLVKFTSTGSVEWSRAVGGTTSDDYGFSVVQTSDGGLAIAGYTRSFGAGDWDFFLVKFTAIGTVEWSRAVGGTSSDYGTSVVQTSDGGFAVAGETYSYGAGTPDSSNLLLVKFDSEGNSCIGEAVSPTVTIASPSVASPSPSVASPSPTVTDVSPTVTVVSPTVTEICTDDIIETVIKPAEFEISVSPNPFNSSCAISAPKGAKIEIFDVEGKKIMELSNGQRIWTPNKEIGSGIYLVKATTKNGQSATKRIVFMK